MGLQRLLPRPGAQEQRLQGLHPLPRMQTLGQDDLLADQLGAENPPVRAGKVRQHRG